MRGGRVAIIGANGQLGSDLTDAFADWDLVALTHADLELCDFAQTRQVLRTVDPNVVINTAAFVRVDECEDEIGKAFLVNAFAVRDLARICASLDSLLVHISTDYIFDGKKHGPYAEDDLPGPINVYGASKLAGEHFVRAICPKHLIVRTSGLYGTAGSSGKGGNFVETMLRRAEEKKPLRVVDDQRLGPTFTADVARAIVGLIEADGPSTTMHVTNAGDCSWFEFAQEALRLAGYDNQVTPIRTGEFPAKAPRPAYSVLSTRRLAGSGVTPLRTWREALRAYIDARG